MNDVEMGLGSTLIYMAPSSLLIYDQLIGTSVIGGVLRHHIKKRVRSIELLQIIAGFHSFVRDVVASTDSIGDIMIYSLLIANISLFHAISIYLGA